MLSVHFNGLELLARKLISGRAKIAGARVQYKNICVHLRSSAFICVLKKA